MVARSHPSFLSLTYGDAGQQWSEEEVVSWGDDGHLELPRLQVADDAQSRPTGPENDQLLFLSGKGRLCKFLDVFPAIVAT